MTLGLLFARLSNRLNYLAELLVSLLPIAIKPRYIAIFARSLVRAMGLRLASFSVLDLLFRFIDSKLLRLG